MERLILRLGPGVERALGTRVDDLLVLPAETDVLPTVRCQLPRPAKSAVSLTVRVHSSNGVPLASATVDVRCGDTSFETAALNLLAMEGYAHLQAVQRRAVEERVWLRRAYATAEVRR